MIVFYTRGVKDQLDPSISLLLFLFRILVKIFNIFYM